MLLPTSPLRASQPPSFPTTPVTSTRVTRLQTGSLPIPFFSPDGKVYPLNQVNGRQVFFVSPNTKRKGDLIYRIKNVSDGRRYIGSVKQTDTNTCGKRLSKYHSEVNSTERKPRQHIVHALRRSPRKFTLKVLDHQPGISEPDLLKIEEQWQDKFRTRERKHGYNHSRPTLERLRTGKIGQRESPAES